MTPSFAGLALISYIVTGIFIYLWLRYQQETDSEASLGGIFWPVVLLCLVVVGPFWLIGKLGNKIASLGENNSETVVKDEN